MREQFELFTKGLDDLKTITKREYLLTITVGVLAGILVGIYTAPAKKRGKITCGNNFSNNYCQDENGGCKDDCCCGDDCGCEE